MFASTKAVEAALAADCPSPQAKLLLALLATFVGPPLQAFPSFATLRQLSGIKSEAALRGHLKALEGAGLLRIEQDHARNGRQTSNVYTLLVPVPGCTPAAPMDKPRRTHANGLRRPVDKPVRKAGGKRSNTPQNMRGHPSESDPSYPSENEGLEPSHINKEGEAPTNATSSPPWKGRRYAAPAAPVIAGRKASEGARWGGEGKAKLDDTLRRLEASVFAASGAGARSVR